jgi:molybdopterin-guanine dinucleotide biosynthesis protein A
MSNIIDKNKYLAFVILIGGKSNRFGTDKGIFEFLGKPLISYQLEILSQFNHDIFLVANSQQQIQNYINKINYEQVTAFILDDKTLIQNDHIRSPMIGMYSAFKELNKFGYKKAFTLSCDMPLIKSEVIEVVLKYSRNYDCCIPKWENNYLEPLFAIYPIDKALQKITKNLEKNIFKLIKILDNTWNIRYISIENEIQPLDKDLFTFVNINAIFDVKKLTEIYQNK